MYDVKNANEENVDESILNGALGRLKSVLLFIRFLDKLDKNVFVGIDGSWGSGKTFFVKQVKRVLEINQKKNPKTGKEEEIFRIVKEKLDLYDIKFIGDIIPIYYDAWQNDDDIDPILSVVNRIVYESRSCVDHGLFNSIEYDDVAVSILSVFCSGIKQLKKDIKGNNILEYYKRKKI